MSARNAGIPTERLTISLFMISGFCAAFLGVCQAMTYQSAQVVGGQSFIFNSIMCVVIGGVLLTGGFGSVVGIVIGTITFAMVNQGIYFTPFDPNFGSDHHRRASAGRGAHERHVPPDGALLFQQEEVRAER